ncbi:DUF262 domain-containing protein [Floridanema aerugineum]|uniref:DUF262 domain-containing protein n=1 Tax=Floridaenema aerugineum BLCC-F46 TaxID=3153654 RepID=A0ABV4XDW3_9CYAN
MEANSFTAVSENFLKIINEALNAKIVIPVGFQRSFVWNRDDIEQLLTSILYGYFIGTFLILETPANKPMFPFEPVEGVKKVNSQANPKNHTTVRLVLDGQQRITSLFYALYEADIPLRGSKNPYRFYLRFDEALNGAIDDSVTGISVVDLKRKAELDQLVYTHKALRFSSLLDTNTFNEWLYTKQNVWDNEQRKSILKFQQRLTSFQVPVVDLSEETDWQNIVNTFDRINRTGVKLSLFHLIGAQLYLKNVQLRKLWEIFEKSNKDVITAIKPEFLLRVIALQKGKEPRKRNLLEVINELEGESFNLLWKEATESIVEAHKRITSHYGAFEKKWIPYSTLIIPLACLLNQLKMKSAGEEDYRKLDCWYWGSIFSRRYDQAVDTKTYQDVRDIGNWINRNEKPEWLKKLSTQDLNLDIDEPQSAIYLGIMNLVASRGAKDFLNGQPAKLHQCEDDHIFPEGIYRKEKGNRVDLIFNRTLISEKTNTRKGKKLPSDFFSDCLSKHGNDEARLLNTLSSHLISKEAYYALKENNFEKFIAERHKTLNEAIKNLFVQTMEDNMNFMGEVGISEVTQIELFDNQQVMGFLANNNPIITSPCTTNQLADLFGIHRDTLVRNRFNKNFTDWTKKYDPEGIGWIYSEENQLFYRESN